MIAKLQGMGSLPLLSAVGAATIAAGYLSWQLVNAPDSAAAITGTSSAKVTGQGNTTTPGNNGNGKGGGNDNKTFTITGVVTGLHPGVTGKQLTLSLQNNSNSPIIVRSLTVTVGQMPSGCTKSMLIIGGLPATQARTFAVNINIARNGLNSYTVPISMAASAPNACADRTFPLQYSGQADQA